MRLLLIALLLLASTGCKTNDESNVAAYADTQPSSEAVIEVHTGFESVSFTDVKPLDLDAPITCTRNYGSNGANYKLSAVAGGQRSLLEMPSGDVVSDSVTCSEVADEKVTCTYRRALLTRSFILDLTNARLNYSAQSDQLWWDFAGEEPGLLSTDKFACSQNTTGRQL